MLSFDNVPAVDRHELLARFVFAKSHIRTSDGTLKADAFLPHPYPELSVTRHRDASEPELWEVGRTIGERREPPIVLRGRGDVYASMFMGEHLDVRADPIDDPTGPPNPNHAVVAGWPSGDKARQRAIALRIAEKSRFVRAPM